MPTLVSSSAPSIHLKKKKIEEKCGIIFGNTVNPKYKDSVTDLD